MPLKNIASGIILSKANPHAAGPNVGAFIHDSPYPVLHYTDYSLEVLALRFIKKSDFILYPKGNMNHWDVAGR